VPAIGALDHDDACVVIDRHDPDRNAGEQLAHDITSSGCRPAAFTVRANGHR
jgi:hypothetical protein